jgi:hypothetical protein
VIDATIALILFYGGELSECFHNFRDFTTSARLRIAEASYALTECLDSQRSMSQLHLYNALQMELRVIEAYTASKSFAVFGIAVDSGRVSQFVALIIGLQQQFLFDSRVLDYGMLVSIDGIILFSLVILNAAAIAIGVLGRSKIN